MNTYSTIYKSILCRLAAAAALLTAIATSAAAQTPGTPAIPDTVKTVLPLGPVTTGDGGIHTADTLSGTVSSGGGSSLPSDLVSGGKTPWTPAAEQNYIKTRSYIDGYGMDYVTDAEYYDGLGYLIQRQSSSATPFGGTVVLPVVYDNMHRQDATTYLPYTHNESAMSYRQNAVSEQEQWYAARFNGDRWAHSYTWYESGFDGRPTEVMRPGWEYHGADLSTTISYSLNEVSDSVRVMGFDPAGFCILPDGWYPANSLQKVSSTDEDGRTSAVFSDASGKTLLTRRYAGQGESGPRADTYYVYDVRDSLVCVIQPEGVPHIEESMAQSSDEISLDTDFIDKWCFTWLYDDWGNIIESHVPGGATCIYAYDERNRLLYYQDSDMAENDIWIFRAYDDLDRLTEEYFCTRVNGRFNKIANLHKISYYDTDGSHIPQGHRLEFQPNLYVTADQVSSERCLTMPSYECFYQVPTSADRNGWQYYYHEMVEKAYYYNSDGRLIQTVERCLDGVDGTYSFRYDFVGNIELTLETHIPSGTADAQGRLLTEYTYDSRGRVLSSTATLNGERPSTVYYTYDELGRLNGKTFNCPAEEYDGLYKHAEESVSRNLQGWVDGTRQFVDDSLMFDMKLDYFGKQTGTTPSYTGLVSGVSYSRGSDSTGVHRYAYSYDALGMLAGARHIGENGEELGTDTEKDIAYDMNGNILALTRCGHDTADTAEVLCYAYDGNRLVSISRYAQSADEQSTEESGDSTSCVTYAYVTDDNGRVIYDGHQGLHITYNLLNLPQSITTEDDMTTEYVYLSDGTKTYAGDTSDEGCGICYSGNFVYYKSTVPSPADGSPDDVFTLQSVATPEGRIVMTEDGPVDLWYAKDYLGNVRNVVSLSETPQILEQNDYLPFGTRIANQQLPQMASNRWRYAGKEEQASLVGGGCNMLDFGFRSYDPWTARWTTPDPKAEKYVESTPYNYCADSPVNCIDPQGDTIVVLFTSGIIGHMALLVQNENGEYKLYSKNGDKRTGSSHEAIYEMGRGANDVNAGSHDSPEEFLSSKDNTDTDPKKPPYESALVIPTDSEQDKKAAKVMTERVNADYNLVMDNCAQAVLSALETAGVPTTINKELGTSPNTLPSMVYPNIIMANPGAKILHKK